MQVSSTGMIKHSLQNSPLWKGRAVGVLVWLFKFLFLFSKDVPNMKKNVAEDPDESFQERMDLKKKSISSFMDSSRFIVQTWTWFFLVLTEQPPRTTKNSQVPHCETWEPFGNRLIALELQSNLPEVWNFTLSLTKFFALLILSATSFIFQICAACQAKYLGSICGREKAWFKLLERCQDEFLGSQMDILSSAITTSVIPNCICYTRQEKTMISSTSSTPSLQISARE